MPTHSLNPVQIIQGYVERTEKVQIGVNMVDLQKSYPGAKVTVFSRRPNSTSELAEIFNRDGSPKTNPINLLQDTAYYAFYAQTGRYDIEFTKDLVTFMLEDVQIDALVYNVRDFGAKGDGVANDYFAINDAILAMVEAYNESQGVGTLFIPNGRYKVVCPEDQAFAFDLPSGIIIQGTAGPYTGTTTSNCQIVLASAQRSIFRIRTNRHKIVIRDLALTTTIPGYVDTIAIDLREEEQIENTYSSNIEFNNLTIWGFERGISVEGSGAQFQWDVTGVRINHCVIGECRYAIYLNSQNCDFMRIVDSRIGTIGDGFSIYMLRVGIITIDSVLGVGSTDPVTGNLSSSFIYITAGHGTVTIINSECEGFKHSIEVVGPGAVDNISWPIVLLNCTFGNEVLLNSRCDLVSLGNHYLVDSVRCGEQGVDVMVFSFGDIFVGTNKLPDPDFDFQLTGISRLASRANRYRIDFGRPARFGGAGGQIGALLGNVPLTVSSFTEYDAQVALCGEDGQPQYLLRATNKFLFVNDPQGVPLLRLDPEGNLAIKGALSQL